MAGRIAIPIYDWCPSTSASHLVAYVGRSVEEGDNVSDKYKFPPNFHKSLVVYNLFRAQEFARNSGLILVEGFFDCMALWQAGVRNVAAIMGRSLSPAQEELIVTAVDPVDGRVTLLFDEDGAGRRCRDEVLERLSRRVFVKVIELPEEGMQPDQLSDEFVRELV
jgi:DNA primase